MEEMEVIPMNPQRYRVRVWFGDHVVADYTAEAALADRYAKAMARRFAGLRVTTDGIPEPGSAEPRRDRLWM
jgi:hypothetical protein